MMTRRSLLTNATLGAAALAAGAGLTALPALANGGQANNDQQRHRRQRQHERRHDRRHKNHVNGDSVDSGASAVRSDNGNGNGDSNKQRNRERRRNRKQRQRDRKQGN